MALGQELKDFVSGFQSGYKLVSDAEYDKKRMNIAERQLALQEKQQAFTEQMAPLEMEATRARIDNMRAETEWQRKMNADPSLRYNSRPSADELRDNRLRDAERELGIVDTPTRASFMPVVQQAISNPYSLAAIDAFGHRESGWDPQKVNASWDDLGAPSGGTLSWRAERLEAMKRHPGSDTAEGQASFFLTENKDLIPALNNAKSVDEAVAIMSDRWRYKGYNDPNNPERRARTDLARRLYSQYGQAIPTDEA